MSKAQEWARKRNYMKFCLMGMFHRLRYLEVERFATTSEKARMAFMKQEINRMMQVWDKETIKSKEEYMK